MDFGALREDMVDGLESDLKAVLESEALGVAMREVPRHEFVPDERSAYADCAHERLGTRILAPRTVARLLEALALALESEGVHSENTTVLVVGAGVGYSAAVIAELVGSRNVHAVDIARPMVVEARENLARAGYEGVLVDRRDGASGLPEYAPFDRILIEAAAVSPPPALIEQLTETGRLVYPHVGPRGQRLVAVDADGERRTFDSVSFKPLLVEGEQFGSVERNRTDREDLEFATQRTAARAGWELDWLEWDGNARRR